jgi:hypothetical protein
LTTSTDSAPTSSKTSIPSSYPDTATNLTLTLLTLTQRLRLADTYVPIFALVCACC